MCTLHTSHKAGISCLSTTPAQQGHEWRRTQKPKLGKILLVKNNPDGTTMLTQWMNTKRKQRLSQHKHTVANVCETSASMSNCHIICYIIFASQGLRPAPLLSTLGRICQNFVIPAYRPLADLWNSAHCITSLSTNENGCTITCSKGCSLWLQLIEQIL